MGARAVGHPRRTCIGCRRVADPAELVRVVARIDSTLAVGNRLPGRGVWLCAGSAACLDAAEHRGAFGRSLRRPISAAAIAELRGMLGW